MLILCHFHCIKYKKQRKFNITPYGEIFISLITGIKFKIWRVSFLPLKILGLSSGFRTRDDLPRAHWDETV